MSLLHNDRVFRYLTRWIVCGVHTDEPVCALSFDDGPSRRNTPRLLDLLERHDCRATFFVLGKHVHRSPHLLKRIAAAGHEIGNHTYHHPYLTLCPNWLIRREVEQAGRIIEQIVGERPSLFRPPAGWFNQRTLRVVEDLGYSTVLGDVYPRDPRRPGVQRIVDEVLGRVQPGSIVILHDGSTWGDLDRSQTLEAVDQIIPQLGDRGLRLVTVSELLEAGAVLRPDTLDQRPVSNGENDGGMGVHRDRATP